MKHDVTRIRLGLDNVEQRRQLRALPLPDRTPAFDAVVARDLRSRLQRSHVAERQTAWRFDETSDFEPIIGEALRGQRLVRFTIRHRSSIAAKARRQVGLGKFLRHRFASGDERLRRMADSLAC